MYEITFNVPDERLLQVPLGDDRDDTFIPVIALNDDKTHTKIQDDSEDIRRYPTRARRSGVGNQPYDTYTPQTTFLQLRAVQVHRSVLETSCLTRMTKEERLLATTMSPMEPMVDDAMHKIDPELCTTSEEEMMVWAYLMTHYNLKPGLRKFGARGVTAAVKALTQLHIMNTWTPLEVTKLSQEKRMCTLSSLLFLKEKRTGDIKGRACINGVLQRTHIPNEDAALPTVSTESTFVTLTVAASEKRKVRCYDVPSAFVNTEIDKDVIMVLKGDLAHMMVQIAPEIPEIHNNRQEGYEGPLRETPKSALRTNASKPVLLLRKEFEGYGLIVNPYDPCIANTMTKGGKQLMVVWHVDDLMVLCEDNFELTKFSCYLGNIYGMKLSMHIGCKHDYLAVDMKFCEDGAL